MNDSTSVETDTSDNLSIINIAMQHLKDCETRSIKIPEWKKDGKPVEIFCRPVNLEVLQNMHAIQEGNSVSEAYACAVFIGALNKDGTQMFKGTDLRFLRTKVSYRIMERIFNFLKETDTLVEAEKK